MNDSGLITTIRLHKSGSEASSVEDRLVCTIHQLSQFSQSAYYSSSQPHYSLVSTTGVSCFVACLPVPLAMIVQRRAIGPDNA